ncbi:MAG: histidine phosphatase family protein [Salana multivorans]|uniref:histidine phosphatase family protein n=1 Tax=Salana multivorans TaxID=120377 RepID=UPI000B1F4DB5|nr:histidine phosphatase family protein [Salana multivorans]MBN8881968.1 histidine phosphatase family protein [Salana multivorans]
MPDGRRGASRVVLLRHGQTDYNVAGRLQGQVDIPLNEAGVAQAQAAASVVAGFRPSVIVASDLQRAVETAQAVAEALARESSGGSHTVVMDARLRERAFGELEGMYDAEIRERYPSVWSARRAGERLVGVGAEDRGEVGARFAEAVWEHAAAAPDGSTILAVAHGACIALGITALLGLDPEEFTGIRGIGNCHWSVLGPSRVPGTWRLESHNVAA